MQKIILALVFCFFISIFSSNAQLTANFGVKGGANFATVLGDGAPSASALVGPHAGGLVHFSGSNQEGIVTYAIQPEIYFSMQGAKYGSDKTTLSYINIPVMVQRYIAGSGFYIETGPQLGILVSAKEKIAGVQTDIKDRLKTIDFSANFGLGYKFQSGIGINARYGLGITTVNSSGYDIRNAVISAGLFYVFGGSRSYY